MPPPPIPTASLTRKIFIGGEDLHFECAHFIVQKPLICSENSPRKIIKEPIHGHSYKVEINLVGEVQDDGYVIDFRTIRREAKRICREWTHHIILPLLSPCLKIQVKTKEKDTVKVSYFLETTDGDEYLFPHADCLPLSIKHSSAEELAEAFWTELKRRMIDVFIERKIISMSVTIFERVGSSATYEAPLYQKSVKRAASKSLKEEV